MPWIRGLTALLITVCVIALVPRRRDGANLNDFIAYWSAARQALVGNNPYETAPVLALERQIGFTRPDPLIMRNPPWAVPFVALFGLFPFATAQALWLSVGLIAVLVSARWLWELYLGPGQPAWIGWMVAGSFSPVAVVLAIGQIGPLVLLGVAGFMHFEKRGKPGWAGFFALLIALKPHLVFLFWVALLLWSVRARPPKTLAALALVLVAASLVALALDHAILVQYLTFIRHTSVAQELTPTVGGLLRLWLGQSYLQMLPAFLALVWFFFYWRKHREHWQWGDQMPLLLLISLLTTSYGWFFDQVVLLPCVFQAIAWGLKCRRTFLVGVGIAYLGVNVAALALIVAHRTTFWYVWTVPAWCFLYLLVRFKCGTPQAAASQALA